jgi:hypothetical protein
MKAHYVQYIVDFMVIHLTLKLLKDKKIWHQLTDDAIYKNLSKN